MRLLIKDGRWFETTKAIRVNDRMWFTHRGNWLYRRLAEAEVIEEAEAVQILLSDGMWFEDHDGWKELPDHVKEQLQSHLDSEYAPEDEV